MGRQFNKKITWMIKNVASLQSEKIYSDPFVVGGCKWRLCAYPKGNNVDYLFLYLEVADYESLPSGWGRLARYIINIVNPNSAKRSKQSDEQKWFNEKSPRWGRLSMFPLNELKAKDSGYLVNGELRIVAEIEVLQVIGKLDVTQDSSIIVESMDVNGFQLLPSHVGFVSQMFEKYPEMASEFRPKNSNLRTGYMRLLISLIESLRQSPEEFPMDDLNEAYAAQKFMTEAGFQLDWLEEKLDEMSAKKEREEASKTRMQEIVKEMKDLEKKHWDLQLLLEKEKKEVSATKAPISFDDVI